MRLAVALGLLVSLPGAAKMVQRPVTYAVAETSFEGVLVYDDAVKAKRPGLLLVPNWLGITPANLKQAELVAGQRYVVLVADMYGKGVRPQGPDEAGKLAGGLKGDRPLMRARVTEALNQLRAASKSAPVDVSRLGAIGFCFGGTTALELARSGATVQGVVSFHGGLSTPKPTETSGVTARVLALHGADDPYVPADEVKSFEDEMRAAKVDWQLVKYGGAVHSFTDVDAKDVGKAHYHAAAARRAYQLMNSFFDEAFAKAP